MIKGIKKAWAAHRLRRRRLAGARAAAKVLETAGEGRFEYWEVWESAKRAYEMEVCPGPRVKYKHNLFAGGDR